MAQFRADDLVKLELFVSAFYNVMETLNNTSVVLLFFELISAEIANTEFLTYPLFAQLLIFPKIAVRKS